MRLIKPSFEILSSIDGESILSNIERAGRTCYKSEDKITESSAKDFVAMIIRRGHESVLEHEKLTVKFVCDRGVSHELVRHRIASFSQESTRYCNYGSGDIAFIIPPWTSFDEGLLENIDTDKYSDQEWSWLCAMVYSEEAYKDLIEQGWRPEQARSVLPNSLKTEIIVTANLREWRLIFKQRTVAAAHPQMRELMIPLHEKLKILIPVIFDIL
jgi:thymidylate synthase (FAD)